MTPEERRAQVQAALIEAIKVVLRTPSWPPGPYRPLSERIATAILGLRDPDGQPMILVRDLDQTMSSTVSDADGKTTLSPNVLPLVAEFVSNSGFVKCLPEEGK